LTAKTRKQVYDLTIADLERCSIWEHAIDEEGEKGQDEATVRPRLDITEANPAEGIFVVKAELTANDGTSYCGYCYAEEQDSSLGAIQPHIIAEGGQVSFWCGIIEPKEDAIRKDYGLLGKTSEKLFPLRFKALVPTKGVRLEGTVPAYLFKTKEGEVVEVR